MTTLGVFRDDYYDPVSVLPHSLYTAVTQASGVLTAANITGASEVFLQSSGATALTTDTGANIISAILTSIQTNAVGAFPAPSIVGVGFSYVLNVRNTNAGTLTLTAGTGVSITGTASAATGIQRRYLVTVSAPATVNLQDLGGFTVT